MRILAISGSLRAGGANNAVLDAARRLAPPGVEITHYAGLRALPAFDPDLDTIAGDALPQEAAQLRAAVGRADALLLSSPEYAHGIAGAFKNALDWLVGSVEFPGKPVALLNASAHAVHAHAQLVEVLTTMNARLVPEASIVVHVGGRSVAGRPFDGPAVAADAALGGALRGALRALCDAVASRAR
ncbi:MAG TPA: NADPH-dependent FMN reductase [Gemmatirosa sp.]